MPENLPQPFARSPLPKVRPPAPVSLSAKRHADAAPADHADAARPAARPAGSAWAARSGASSTRPASACPPATAAASRSTRCAHAPPATPAPGQGQPGRSAAPGAAPADRDVRNERKDDATWRHSVAEGIRTGRQNCLCPSHRLRPGRRKVEPCGVRRCGMCFGLGIGERGLGVSRAGFQPSAIPTCAVPATPDQRPSRSGQQRSPADDAVDDARPGR